MRNYFYYCHKFILEKTEVYLSDYQERKKNYFQIVSLQSLAKCSFTLSTPALRMKFPFLFHFNANIGPLCCPKVLARLPKVKKKKNNL